MSISIASKAFPSHPGDGRRPDRPDTVRIQATREIAWRRFFDEASLIGAALAVVATLLYVVGGWLVF